MIRVPILPLLPLQFQTSDMREGVRYGLNRMGGRQGLYCRRLLATKSEITKLKLLVKAEWSEEGPCPPVR